MQLIATNRTGQTRSLAVASGDNLMEVLRDNDLEIEAVCGGCCACATCHVLVAPQWLAKLPPRGAMETELLSLSDYFDESQSRLSCQLSMRPELDQLQLTVAPED